MSPNSTYILNSYNNLKPYLCHDLYLNTFEYLYLPKYQLIKIFIKIITTKYLIQSGTLLQAI